MKTLFLLLALFFNLLIVNAQFKMDNVISYPLGDVFSYSKDLVTKFFDKQPVIKKSDFYNAYQIIFDDVPFDYYGKGNYLFQYVKDTLVFIEVTMKFRDYELDNFKRLYNTLMDDINLDKSKILIKAAENINFTKSLQIVKYECGKYTHVMDSKFFDIESKFIGENVWKLYNNSEFKGKFLGVSLSTGKLGLIGNKDNYVGCTMNVVLRVDNTDFLNLVARFNKVPLKYTVVDQD